MKIEADVHELVELVSSVTEAYTTAFFLADNERRVLKLWDFYSLGDNVIVDASIPFGAGPIGWVAENLKPFDLSKFSERDSGLLRLYSKNEDVKSFFAVPVAREGVLEGVLCIDSKRAFVFANKDQKLLTLFAKQFADLVNNVRVRKFVDTEASDVAFLHSFCRKVASADNVESILQLTLDSVTRLVECDSCFLSLRFDNSQDAVGACGSVPALFRIEATSSVQNVKSMTFSDQDGLAGRVIRDKEPFLLANRKGDFGSYVFAPSRSVGRVRSFLGVPLLVKEDVLGLMCFTDSKQDSFNQRDLRVVSIIADNVSLAIANAEAQGKVHSLSTITDGLTGLYNFSGFRERLEIAFQEASRKRRPLSLVIMDLDNFKELNNACGYEVGNEVLRKLAQIMLRTLSKDDSISAARYGPDEFALILPSITGERAFFIAEKIREAVEDPTFIAPSCGVCISISIGVSSFPRDSMSKNELVDDALRSLSSAKSRGSGADYHNVEKPETASTSSEKA
jgi:diguanylate cyclase (GGDEF)-like protein